MGNMIIVGPNGKRFTVNAPAGATPEEIEETFARQNGGARGTVTTTEAEDARLADLKNQYNSFQSQPGNNAGLLQNIEGGLRYNTPPEALGMRVVPDNPEDIGYGRKTGDILTGISSGTWRAGGALAGLGTYVPYVNQVADPVAESLYGIADQIDETFMSDFQLSKKRELQADLQASVKNMPLPPEDATLPEKIKHVADYIITQGGAAGSFLKDNPGQIANFIGETVPHIFLGGALGKGAGGSLNLLDNAVAVGSKAKGVTTRLAQTSSATLGATGEGLIAAGDVGAGTAIEQRAQGNDQYDASRLYGLLAAPVTAIVGRTGGKFSGVADADTLAAKAFGAGTQPTDLINRSLAGRVTKGAAIEGVEELVQGGTEEVFSNLANDRDPYENVGSTAVIGMATGAGLGAGVNTAAYGADKLSPNGGSSGTDLDSGEAQLQAAEDAELEVQKIADDQLAEQQALAAQRQAKIERMEAAKSFMPEAEFIKQRTAKISSDVADPNTEIGSAYFEYKLDNDINPANEKEETAAQKKFLKDFVPSNDADVARGEFTTALDAYAADLKAGVVVAQPVAPTIAEETNRPIVTVDTPVRRRTDAQTKADALLPEGWIESGNYDDVASAINGQKFKVKTFNDALSAALEPTVPDAPTAPTEDASNAVVSEATDAPAANEGPAALQEQAQDVNTLTDKSTATAPKPKVDDKPPEKPTVTEEQAKLANDWAARNGDAPIDLEGINVVPKPPVKAALEEDPSNAASIISGMEADAISFATDKLGENWRTEFPSLVEDLKGKKFAKFQKTVNESAPEQLVAEAETSTSTDIAQQLAQPLPAETKLSPNEQKVWDVINNAFQNNEEDSVVQVDGKWNTKALAELAGLKSRQAAQTAMARLKPKLAKAYGKTQAEITQRLAETRIKNVEEAPSADAPISVLDEAALGEGGGSSTIASINQGARTGMDPDDAAFMEARSLEPDEYETKRQEIAAKERDNKNQIMVQTHGRDAMQAWRNGVSDGGPQVNQLGKKDLMDWIGSVEEHKDGFIDDAQLAQDLRDIENKYDQNNAGPSLEDTNARQTNESTAVDVAGQGARNTTSAQSGNQAKQVGDEDTGESGRGGRGSQGQATQQVSPVTAEDILAKNPDMTLEQAQNNARVINGLRARKQRAAEAADNEQFTPTVAETKPKFGLPAASAQTPTSRENFASIVEQLTGERSNMRIHIFDSEADAVSAINLGDVPSTDVDALKNAQPFGWVQEDADGVPHAHFILDRVEEGQELPAFMHEVGGHMGIDTVIDSDTQVEIAAQIADWADQNDSSQASKLAIRAMARVEEASKVGGVPDGAVISEAIAYFLEEAAAAGVTPTTKGALGDFVRSIYDKFIAALRKLNFQNVDSLTPQDIVNMAYGAARLELVGDMNNATAAASRSTVNPARMGVKQSARVAATKGWVAENFKEAGQQVLDDTALILTSGFDSIKPLHQIVQENAETLPSMGSAYDAVLAYEKSVNEFMLRLDPIAKAAKALKQDRLNVVNSFLGRSTYFQKWGYDPQIEGRDVKVDPIMARAFERLNPDEQALVKSVFKHGEDVRVEMAKLSKELGIPKAFMYDSKLDGPYSPLKRFGNFVAELKSAELIQAEQALEETPNKINRDKLEKLKSEESHYVLKFFGSIGGAKKFARSMEGKYEYAVASPKSVSASEGQRVNPQLLERVMAAIGADTKTGLDSSTQKAVRDVVEKLYVDSLEETNARLSGVKRRNRAGFEENMMQSFFSHAQSQARLVAQMRHGKEVNQEIANTQAAAKKDYGNLQGAANMFARHYQKYLAPREGVLSAISDRVASFNTVTALTSNIGYHVTNAVQPLVSIQKTASDFNDYTGAWAAQIKAYKIAREVIDGSLVKQIATAATSGLINMGNDVEIDVSKAPKHLRPMLENLQLRQLLDVGIEQDLNFNSRFDTGYAPVDWATDQFKNISDRLYQTARYVEAYNRVASSIAAFEMANKHRGRLNKMGMTASDYATAVTEDTQGNFSKLDSAMLFKALPKLTTQYRKYQVMMALLWTDAFKKSFKPATPEERAVGLRMLAYSAGHTAMISGVTGLPFVASIGWLVSMFGGEEDDPDFDLERYIRTKVLPEDEKLATLLSRGLPAFLGVDMSQKLKQSDIFTPFPFSDFEATEDGTKNTVLEIGLGPTANTIGNMGRARKYFGQGDWFKGTEYLMPKGVRSMMESTRMATEGYTMPNGDAVLDPREIDLTSLILNSLGLPPSDIAKLKWTRSQQYEIAQYYSTESSRIRKDYIEASNNRDREALKELREEWRSLQKSKRRVRPFFNNERGTLKPQPLSDLLRAPRAQQKRERKYRKQLTGN